MPVAAARRAARLRSGGLGDIAIPPGRANSRPGSGCRNQIAIGPQPIRCVMGHRGQVEAHRARTKGAESPDATVRVLGASTSDAKEFAAVSRR